MAERAHPDLPGFKNKFQWGRWKGIVPYIKFRRSPYLDSLKWRYAEANKLSKGKNTLDIPCGMGWGTSMIRHANTLVGVDISHEAVQEAQSRYGSKARFMVGDMNRLDFPKGSLQFICCLEGIEHVPPEVAKEFISECYRVLSDAGELLLSSPHCIDAPHSGNPYHIKEYQPEELREMLRPYFDVLTESRRPVENLVLSLFHARKKHRHAS